ncbi:MAG: LysM repeat protein, partial [Arcticibacterium sp.]
RYNLSVNTLELSNPSVSAQSLAAGSNLKIPVQAIHTVGAGDILRIVGGKYGITTKAIMTANGKTKNFSERGEKLIIPFKVKQ